jgi:hypothetical protein
VTPAAAASGDGDTGGMSSVRRAKAARLLLSGLLGLVMLGCGDVASGGAPATTPDAATATTAPMASPTQGPSPADAVPTSTPTPTQAPTPAPTARPTSPPAPPPPAAGVALPNPRLTPGETFAGVTVAQICTPGYSSSVRHVEHQQYVDVYAAYGVPYPEPAGTYELDHLIPLELGGDNADANLWPEPASPTPGFHQKDDLENRMHELVCSGQLALGEAQVEIASNWYAAYRRYLGQ